MPKGEPYTAVIVEPGDTLMLIAARELGGANGWRMLARLNNMRNDGECRHIQPGDLLIISGNRPVPDQRPGRYERGTPWG